MHIYTIGPTELLVLLGVLSCMAVPVVVALVVIFYLLVRQRKPPSE